MLDYRYIITSVFLLGCKVEDFFNKRDIVHHSCGVVGVDKQYTTYFNSLKHHHKITRIKIYYNLSSLLLETNCYFHNQHSFPTENTILLCIVLLYFVRVTQDKFAFCDFRQWSMPSWSECSPLLNVLIATHWILRHVWY